MFYVKHYLNAYDSVNAPSLPLTSTVSTFSGVPPRFALIAADAALSAERIADHLKLRG
jgi:hypothetical protein